MLRCAGAKFKKRAHIDESHGRVEVHPTRTDGGAAPV
jgi:hypothetical protein